MESKQSKSGCVFELDRYVYYRPRLQGLTHGCQFDEDEVVSAGGARYCVFHLPPKEKKNWTNARIEGFNNQIMEILNLARIRKQLADLSGVVFPGAIRFGSNDRNLTPLPGTVFLKAVFLDDADFRGVVFEDIVLFDHSRFHGQALLYNVRYEGEAHFSHAQMGSNVHLGDSLFNNHAYFQGTHLAVNLFCSNTTFQGRAWFQSALLSGFAYFQDCTFTGEADFSIGNAEEKRLSFKNVTFAGSHFCGRAAFTNRRFLGQTDFSNATFEVAPEFHGCVLHQDTDFSGAGFLDRGKVTISPNLGAGSRQVSAARAYRTLKLAMENIRNSEDEARFFAYEQECVRADPNTPTSAKVVSWCYDKTSDYGQSIHKPLFFLLGASLAFFLINYITLGGHYVGFSRGAYDYLTRVSRFTLRQIVQPFSLIQQEETPFLNSALAIVQGLLNLIFISLTLVAIRRRFKIT